MPQELTTKEIATIFVEFLNNTGNWNKFKDFIEKQGYTLDELSIDEE